MGRESSSLPVARSLTWSVYISLPLVSSPQASSLRVWVGGRVGSGVGVAVGKGCAEKSAAQRMGVCG